MEDSELRSLQTSIRSYQILGEAVKEHIARHNKNLG